MWHSAGGGAKAASLSFSCSLSLSLSRPSVKKKNKKTVTVGLNGKKEKKTHTLLFFYSTTQSTQKRRQKNTTTNGELPDLAITGAQCHCCLQPSASTKTTPPPPSYLLCPSTRLATPSFAKLSQSHFCPSFHPPPPPTTTKGTPRMFYTRAKKKQRRRRNKKTKRVFLLWVCFFSRCLLHFFFASLFPPSPLRLCPLITCAGVLSRAQPASVLRIWHKRERSTSVTVSLSLFCLYTPPALFFNIFSMPLCYLTLVPVFLQTEQTNTKKNKPCVTPNN